ncbi:MAG: bifunctional DNA-formamidopyrimidine glycosylase/DNA-(apurinic or apyrimidinic site) lyase [Thermomicrobiales bacterium]
MPELPEVETIRRIVERELVGRTVTAVEVRLPKLMRDSPLPDPHLLVGQRLERVTRRAKGLMIGFSEWLTVMVHFKLSGQLTVIKPTGDRFGAGHPVPDFTGPYPHRTTHAEIAFHDGTLLYYSDLRQFGWWRLLPTDRVDQALEAFKFGPEATGPTLLTSADLEQRLRRRAIPIKTALLDQSVIAGLGNIYVDEALYRAGVHPSIPANTVLGDALDRLAEAIPWSLERGIEQGGAKIIHHRAYPIDGFPAVHAREGEPCLVCGTTISKTRVGARGTYLCFDCQPIST